MENITSYYNDKNIKKDMNHQHSPKSLHRIDFEKNEEKDCHVMCPNIYNIFCSYFCICFSSPCCKNKNKDKDKYVNVHCKRFTLPIVGVLGLFVFEEVRTYVYVPLVVFIASLSIFWNFPSLILFTNSKPFYYEDLFIDNSHIEILDIQPKIKKRFETIFDTTLILSNSIFISALSDYWLYKIHDKDSYFVIIGISGGILKIFQFINQASGSILLYTIRKYIMKEAKSNKDKPDNKKRKNSFDTETYLDNNTVIEMRSFEYSDTDFTEINEKKLHESKTGSVDDSVLFKRTLSQNTIHRPNSSYL